MKLKEIELPDDAEREPDEAVFQMGSRGFDCDHRNLGRTSRCVGCGRTKNEIALDEE